MVAEMVCGETKWTECGDQLSNVYSCHLFSMCPQKLGLGPSKNEETGPKRALKWTDIYFLNRWVIFNH
jgi:hypothetical protein